MLSSLIREGRLFQRPLPALHQPLPAVREVREAWPLECSGSGGWPQKKPAGCWPGLWGKEVWCPPSATGAVSLIWAFQWRLINISNTGVLGGLSYPSVFRLRELQRPWVWCGMPMTFMSFQISVGRKRELHRVMSCGGPML